LSQLRCDLPLKDRKSGVLTCNEVGFLAVLQTGLRKYGQLNVGRQSTMDMLVVLRCNGSTVVSGSETLHKRRIHILCIHNGHFLVDGGELLGVECDVNNPNRQQEEHRW
jgi:hypothetical protein